MSARIRSDQSAPETLFHFSSQSDNRGAVWILGYQTMVRITELCPHAETGTLARCRRSAERYEQLEIVPQGLGVPRTSLDVCVRVRVSFESPCAE